MPSQNSEFKYVYSNTHLDSRGYQYKSVGHNKKRRFFRHPYLEVYSDLGTTEKELHVGYQKHVFDAKIWSMNVKNVEEHRFKLPLTTSAIDCRPSIQFRTIGQTVPLYWRMYRMEPDDVIPNGQPDTPKSEYLGLLGCDYARDILAYKCGVEKITVNRDEIQQVYFLFTFKESKFAYIITPIDFSTWYGEQHEVRYCNVNGAFLFLKIPGKYDFVLRFNSENYRDINGKTYRVNISEWDKITMSRN